MTSTRRIDAISPTTRNGSQTSAPWLKETRTVWRISMTIKTSKIRSMVTTSGSEAPSSRRRLREGEHGADSPDNRDDREQQAENEIGRDLDAQKRPAGDLAGPIGFLDRPSGFPSLHADSLAALMEVSFLHPNGASLAPRWRGPVFQLEGGAGAMNTSAREFVVDEDDRRRPRRLLAEFDGTRRAFMTHHGHGCRNPSYPR